MHSPRERPHGMATQPAAITGRLIAAHEGERRCIARLLQDDVGQRLALLAAEVELLALEAPDRESFAPRWRELSHAVSQIASDVRHIADMLHPSRLETLGLVAAIGALCREVWSSQRLRVRFTHDRVPPVVPADIALTLFRIVQDCLRNVVDHSGVMEADVYLAGCGHTLHLRIADSGVGFVPAEQGRSGVGLATMCERVKPVGGRLVIDSAPGRGTRIGVKVDLFHPSEDDTLE